MHEFIRIGVDLGKNYFQVDALENEDGGATARKRSRQAMGSQNYDSSAALISCSSSSIIMSDLSRGLRLCSH